MIIWPVSIKRKAWVNLSDIKKGSNEPFFWGGLSVCGVAVGSGAVAGRALQF